MYCSHSSRIRTIAHARKCCRSASTAAALKPDVSIRIPTFSRRSDFLNHGQARKLERWLRPQSSETNSVSVRKPSLGKWAKPPNGSAESPDADQSYRPNLSKWSRQETTRAPKSAILEGLERRIGPQRRTPREVNGSRLSRDGVPLRAPRFPERHNSRSIPNDSGSSSLKISFASGH